MAGGTLAFYNHMRASEVRDRIGAEAFGRLFKFCIEREPVAKCLSYFHMRRNGSVTKPDDDFDLTWQRYCKEGPFPVDTDKYAERMDDGWRLIVDRVIPYERLAEELPALLDQLGVRGFRLETRAKTEYSAQVIVRPEEVTPRERAQLRQRFRGSIAVTGLYAEAGGGGRAQDSAGRPTVPTWRP